MFSPEALLFDLDGVLLDTEPLHGKAWQKTASIFKTTLNDSQLKLLQGRRRNDCAQELANWINQSVEIEEILKVHQPFSKELLKQAKAMEGAESLVNWCFQMQIPIALITSSSSTSVASKTSPHPWLDCLLTKVQGDDPALKAGKPSPDPYLLGAKKLNANPKKCWAIEDSISGTNSALSAGCQVWVLKNNSNKDIDPIKQKSNPLYIDNLNKVLQELKQIYSKLN